MDKRMVRKLNIAGVGFFVLAIMASYFSLPFAIVLVMIALLLLTLPGKFADKEVNQNAR